MTQITTQWLVDKINAVQLEAMNLRKILWNKKEELETLPLYMEVKELEEKIKATQNEDSELRNEAKQKMMEAGMKKFEALDGSIVQLNKKPWALIIEDEEKVPTEYKKEKVTLVINKKQLKQDIQEWLLIDWVFINEDYTLVIKR